MIRLNYRKIFLISVAVIVLAFLLFAGVFYSVEKKRVYDYAAEYVDSSLKEMSFVLTKEIEAGGEYAVVEYLDRQVIANEAYDRLSLVSRKQLIFSTDRNETVEDIYKSRRGHQISGTYFREFQAFSDQKLRTYYLAAHVSDDFFDSMLNDTLEKTFVTALFVVLAMGAAQILILYIVYRVSFKKFYDSVLRKDFGRKYMIEEVERLNSLFRDMYRSVSDTNSSLEEKISELTAQKNLFQSLFHGIPVPVYLKDRDGGITTVNRMYKENFCPDGLDDVSQCRDYDTVHNAEDDKLLMSGGSSVKEVRIIRQKDGAERWVMIYRSAIFDKDGAFNGVIGALIDVTERRELEELKDGYARQLQKDKTELQELVKSEMEIKKKHEQVLFEQKKFADMGQMISAIAHQWRQPLNVLGLLIQDVHEAYDHGELNKEAMNEFERNGISLVSHLSETIDHFRNFFAPDKEKTDFSVVDEMIGLFRLIIVQIRAKDIKMEICCTCPQKSMRCDNIETFAGCPCRAATVRGYIGEFKQSVLNVIYNAADAVKTAEEEGRITQGVIRINVHSDGRCVTAEIADNGGGIPEDIRTRVFDPYFSTKPEGKGTGIGLYMSRLIIENHMGGRLTVENRGGGAVFTIKLPLADAEISDTAEPDNL